MKKIKKISNSNSKIPKLKKIKNKLIKHKTMIKKQKEKLEFFGYIEFEIGDKVYIYPKNYEYGGKWSPR